MTKSNIAEETHSPSDEASIAKAKRPSLLDVEALEAELAASLRGEVRFDVGSRALYATDSSNYRLSPIGVVIPRNRQDIITTVRLCQKHGAPIVSRGGGTSLAGQCCNIAVVMDLSKYYNRVLSIDPEKKTATVEPGIVLDTLQAAVQPHDLIFGPNPATHNHCTIGGMIGNNSCGNNSLLAYWNGTGHRTSDNVESMEVLLYDGTILEVGPTSEEELVRLSQTEGRIGEIYTQLKKLRDQYGDLVRQRFPKIPRRVSGYNLDDLLPERGCNVAQALSGTEGTCVVILKATMKLVPRPKARAVVVLAYPDAFLAGDHVPQILKFKPIGLEGIDDYLVKFIKERGAHADALPLFPPGKGWLIAEFGAESQAEASRLAAEMVAQIEKEKNAPKIKQIDDPKDQEKVWAAREAGLGVTAFVTNMNDTWEGWEDTAVPVDKVGDYLREFRALFDRYDYHPTLYGHYGQGCIHCRIDSDLTTEKGLKHYRAFLDEGADLVVKFGGSISGEHGDGQSKAELLPKMFGDELVGAFGEYKSIWDPAWKMNPGKIVDPNPILSDLRLGINYNPDHPRTQFQYPEDKGDFSRAVLRCVGVGECRRDEGGTMCPSYRVTRDEMHSTRGRAHLLFEMLNGDLIKDGFKSEHVKKALDLCLACKGCKGDCPVHVDVATYKAEFLSHYYKHNPRPIAAYAFGLIGQWARIGSLIPSVANFFQRAPFLSALFKQVLGVAQQREIPLFAPETFKDWFFRQPMAKSTGSPVILWPDTFNNHYHPDVAKAAAQFLHRAGWRVVVPKVALCCGRPLYDYGMLDTARIWLKQILTELREEIRAGVPLVGLEPSCVSVFRDEMKNLLPHDEDAKRLSSQTFLLSEFIQEKMPDYPLPKLEREAMVHGHCHQKSVLQMNPEMEVLKRLGMNYDLLKTSCCGMAGAFGFEKDHYDVSVACGEELLLPSVRKAAPETVIMANGFSCREQIAQETSRKALHLAQVLEMAYANKADTKPSSYPEDDYIPAEPASPTKTEAILAIAAGAVVLGLVAGFFIRQAKSKRRELRTS